MTDKKRILKWLKRILLILLLPVFGLIYFFYSNNAPIIRGEIEYAVQYTENHSLDIYYPTNDIYEKSPVVLFIHGGAWIGGRKESININRINGAINILRDKGYTIFSPEYTLASNNKSPFPDCIIDGFNAIQWIKLHSDSLNLDLNNFGIMGESAGAHIAMMNAFARPQDFNLDHENPGINYVVDMYGPADLHGLYHSQTVDSISAIIEELPDFMKERFNLPEMLFGFDPTIDLERTLKFTDKYSPVSYINTAVPPVLIIHGDIDQLVPSEQSIQLKKILDSLKIENQIHILKDVNHAFVHASDQQKLDIQKWIASFIEQQYKKVQ